MPGLNLQMGGGVRSSLQLPGSTAPPPATAAQAAFGTSLSSAPPSRLQTLAPNDAFGIALWSGVAGVVLLLVVRHSLPN